MQQWIRIAPIIYFDYNDFIDINEIIAMASITIRNLDDAVMVRLRAAQHGWSMEQEVREILQQSLLPAGKRRDALALASDQMFQEDFAGHSLSFNGAAAVEYSLLIAARTSAGRPISTEDAQIASIAICHQLPLVTRNTRDFIQIEKLELHNPWTTSR